MLTFIRYDDAGEPLACVINFSGTPHHDVRLGLPRDGKWDEILNTDATEFGGSGVGNFGEVVAHAGESHGMPAWAQLTLPPLSTVWLAL